MANPLAEIEELRKRMRGGVTPLLRTAGERHKGVVANYARRFMHPGPAPSSPRNYTDRLYIRTGRLAGSLTPGRAGNETTVVARDGVATIRYGTSVVYARIHELGGRAGRGRKSVIPRRPYLRPASEAMRVDVKETIGSDVVRALIELWGRS